MNLSCILGSRLFSELKEQGRFQVEFLLSKNMAYQSVFVCTFVIFFFFFRSSFFISFLNFESLKKKNHIYIYVYIIVHVCNGQAHRISID